MFKRKATDKLKWWKENYGGKYAVLLQGARRVGKSTIAENFAKENYKSYIMIDFSNISSELNEVFDDISNLAIFFLKLQALTSTELYERNSVIIFDEIQLAPKVRQAIKHLVKDGRYDYIETGSLISIKKNVKNILIPSEEIKIDIYPMDYEEFNWACNKDYSIYEKVYSSKKAVGSSTNRILMRDFRTYMAVGGMPQAVEAYINKKSFREIDLIKKEIINLYKDDFRKIDPSGRISAIFESIPSQLALQKNRFFISKATNSRKRVKDEEFLADLIDSKTVLLCRNVKDPSIALNLTTDFDTYKLYFADIGLFITQIFNSKSLVDENIYLKLLGDKLEANLGYIYENAVAQIINSYGRELLYHTWKNENQTHPYEIDFLIDNQSKLIPIEVKSSEVNNHKSINEFSKKYSSRISRRVLFSQSDISHDEMLELKPLYLLPQFLKELEN
ncbi:MAG: ATP-binding protein [Bacilli bacterium]|nr:ATP-binding protein [Bacilli bacterium]